MQMERTSDPRAGDGSASQNGGRKPTMGMAWHPPTQGAAPQGGSCSAARNTAGEQLQLQVERAGARSVAGMQPGPPAAVARGRCHAREPVRPLCSDIIHWLAMMQTVG